MTLLGIGVAVGALAAVQLTVPSFQRLLVSGGLVRKNYQGALVPVAVGFVPALLAALASACLGALGNPFGYPTATTVLAALAVGLLDDCAGDRSASGLRGHLRLLRHGILSTGAVKALVLPLVALVASASLRRPAFWWLADGLLVALAANVVNLLDVQPGRAVKGSLLLFGAAALGGWRGPWADIWLVFVGALLAYSPFDLGARAMLGDSGANAFGMAAAWVCVLALAPSSRIVLLVLLGLVQVLAERRSLSQEIAKRPLLRALDRLGRKGQGPS